MINKNDYSKEEYWKYRLSIAKDIHNEIKEDEDNKFDKYIIDTLDSMENYINDMLRYDNSYNSKYLKKFIFDYVNLTLPLVYESKDDVKDRIDKIIHRLSKRYIEVE